MSARSDARKQFAKEQELEKLRKRKETSDLVKANKRETETLKLNAMSPEERLAYTKKKSRSKMIVAAVIALFVIGIIASAVGGNKTTPSAASTPTTAAAPTADAGVQLGCDHFRNVMSDVSAGLLTDAELRTKIKEIYSDAWVSTNTGIAPAATAMLAADTAGDTTALKTAFTDFSTACNAIGH